MEYLIALSLAFFVACAVAVWFTDETRDGSGGE